MSHEVISIAGFDPFLTEELSQGCSLKRVQVVLTQAPHEQWIGFFESCRRAAKHKASVEAHVVGNYIAFESPADAIERHMKDLAVDVAAANAAMAAARAPAPAPVETEEAPVASGNTPPESVMPSLADGGGMPSPA